MILFIILFSGFLLWGTYEKWKRRELDKFTQSHEFNVNGPRIRGFGDIHWNAELLKNWKIDSAIRTRLAEMYAGEYFSPTAGVDWAEATMTEHQKNFGVRPNQLRTYDPFKELREHHIDEFSRITKTHLGENNDKE